MHPDYLEEMDYQANARYDYISEAYGPTARDAEDGYEEERSPWVSEARYDSHVESCVLALCVFFSWADGIPF